MTAADPGGSQGTEDPPKPLEGGPRPPAPYKNKIISYKLLPHVTSMQCHGHGHGLFWVWIQNNYRRCL